MSTPDREDPARGRAHDVAPLVRLARLGDEPAFRRLHRRFAPMVHAIALAGGRLADADDVVQETFLAAWQRLADLRDEDRFGAWLASIARRRSRRAGRRRDEPAPAEALEEPAAAHADRDDADREDTELAKRALAALAQVPESYREILAMRLVEGMTGPEIAAATGRPAGSVRVGLTRGLKLLRERLPAEPAEGTRARR